MSSDYNGLPAAALAVKLATGANAINTAQNVQKALTRAVLDLSRRAFKVV